jgi:hypothetical protein
MFEKLLWLSDADFIKVCLAQRDLERRRTEMRETYKELEPMANAVREEMERIGEVNGFAPKIQKNFGVWETKEER